MMEWLVVVAAVVFLFLAVDTIKNLVVKRPTVVVTHPTIQENERIVRLEAEVDEKVKELHRQQSERMVRMAPASAAPAPPPPVPSADVTVSRDPMNDTRCMAAVKEKADEMERLVREKGIQKS